MKEQDVKKRGWVKNAALIFLAVMLALTFFSNTIMNRTLPEVGVSFAESGTITARIRGMGTVTANDSFEVILNQTRMVLEVNVRVGNEVSVGDVLFTLADTGSEEIETARDNLDRLLLDYERKIINASLDGNYSRQLRDIRIARENITEAQERLTELPYSQAAIDAARRAIEQAEANVELAELRVTAAENRVESAEAVVTRAEYAVENAQDIIDIRTIARNNAQAYLDELGGLTTAETIALDRQIADATSERNEKQSERNVADIVHGAAYRQFVNAAGVYFSMLPSQLGAHHLAAYAQILRASLGPTATPNGIVIPDLPSSAETYARMLAAYDAITAIDNDIAQLNTTITRLQQDRNALVGGDNTVEFNRRRRRLDDAEVALRDANSDRTFAERSVTSANRELTNMNRDLTNAKTEVANLEQIVAEREADLRAQEGYRDDWRTANDNIRTLQRSHEDLLFSLDEQQMTDGVASAITSLEMRELRNQISRLREEIRLLEEDETGATIVSLVSGIVRQINISPGNQTQSGTPLAVIEVVDRGYSLSITVTEEQARRVSIGDNAEASRGWGWWGMGEIRAVLTQIRNDPQNPATSRILDFDISGDIESGTQLNITIGQRGETFETTVPNAALRSDTNGDFVLVVLARSSPLGNRYIATRADVNILATDDTHSAVVGGLSGWDFVITTSTRPIEPGMQVRLLDNPW